MPQAHTWEREYQNPQLIKVGETPSSTLRQYIRFLAKHEGAAIEGMRVLDLGSGTGKNSIFLAELGSTVTGLEISRTAVDIARTRSKERGVATDYRVADLGVPYPFADSSFDLAIDIMSSNSLNEKERNNYLRETHRVLKPGGHFFVRALCRDGDQNAKNLLRHHPGPEHDTYIIVDMSLTERVFTRQDFTDLYSRYFTIQKLEQKSNYTEFKGQSYKRKYWLAYLKKE